MSDKNSILLADPEFDPNRTSNCTLLLKVAPDSFSYAIIDNSSKKLKIVYDRQECKDIAHDLANRLKNDPYLKSNYATVKVALYTVNSIAIPYELYDAAYLNTYRKFFTEDHSDTLYVQPYTQFGFKTIFTFQQFIEETLTTYLKDSKRYDYTAPVLKLASKQGENTLIFDFTAGSFTILYVKDKKMVFYNCFEMENAEEFNYYVLLMLKQLEMDKSAISVYVSGVIHAEDSYFSALTKYFNHVVLNTPVNEAIDYSLLEDMPSHYYTSLLALDLCE